MGVIVLFFVIAYLRCLPKAAHSLLVWLLLLLIGINYWNVHALALKKDRGVTRVKHAEVQVKILRAGRLVFLVGLKEISVYH